MLRHNVPEILVDISYFGMLDQKLIFRKFLSVVCSNSQTVSLKTTLMRNDI